MPQQLTGRLVTSGGVTTGAIAFKETIETIHARPAAGPYILPGFIDTHVHGGGGGDAMDGPEGVARLAAFHLAHGTTTLCPTTITNPWEGIKSALRGIREVMEEADPNLPEVAGAHLEGPFISPDRLGAQPPYALAPKPELVSELLSEDVITVVTLAPEVKGALEAAVQFARSNVRISIGHSIASFEQARALAGIVYEANGTVGFTHLYNAMSPLTSRAPGLVGAALADRRAFCELILDGFHVHAGSFLAAANAKDGTLHLITDAIRACGLGDVTTELGGQTVTVTKGAARLGDGTLAGSVLTLDRALANALAAGFSLEQASGMLSAVPARYLGLPDRGALAEGLRADIVVMDDDFAVLEVWRAGQKVTG